MMRSLAMLDLEGFIADAAHLLIDAILALAGLIDRSAAEDPVLRRG